MTDQLLQKIVNVTDVEVLHDRVVRLTFDDGCVGDHDLAPTLRRLGGSFTPLAEDDDRFREVQIDLGTITWPNGADLAPEVLHATVMPNCTSREPTG